MRRDVRKMDWHKNNKLEQNHKRHQSETVEVTDIDSTAYLPLTHAPPLPACLRPFHSLYILPLALSLLFPPSHPFLPLFRSPPFSIKR